MTNSVDPDETARYEQSHLDLYCLHSNLRCSAGLQRLRSELIFDPAHDKTNKMACAPSEDSDPPSLISAKDPSFIHADSKDFDQTGWMPKLI